MKIIVNVPEDSRFKTAQDMQEVDRNILQYQGATLLKDAYGLPAQNPDGSWTVLAETDRVDPIIATLERSYNFTVSQENTK